MKKQLTIGFVGMTHLGLNYAAAAAAKGYQVIGYDPDGVQKVIEPGLDEALATNADRIRFTAQAQEVSSCDIIYVSPDVKTDDKGQSDLNKINSLIEQIIPELNSEAILIVLSQVPPGYTRNIDFPKHRLFYQVETLVFGEALERAENPERYILGCNNTTEIPLNLRIYLESYNCPILPMRYESAELAKISINCCLVASISVANTLAELCENLGADWSEIIPALKLDKRIGKYAYLKPGLGIAGGNLERDLATVINLSNNYGTDGKVINSFISNSKHRKNWALRILHQKVLGQNPDANIAIWGLTYKENTHSLKNSPSIYLLEALQEYKVTAYDPATKELDLKCKLAPGAMPAAEGADVLIVMTPWKEFKDVSIKEVISYMRGKIIIDPYAIFSDQDTSDLEYITLGK